MNLREDLLKRWRETGKIGFERVRSQAKAYQLIDTIVDLYEEEEASKEVYVSLKELSKELKNFILNKD